MGSRDRPDGAGSDASRPPLARRSDHNTSGIFSQTSSLPQTPLDASKELEPPTKRKKKARSDNHRRRSTAAAATLTMFNMMQRLRSERDRERANDHNKFAVLQKSKDSLSHLEEAWKRQDAWQPDAYWRQFWDSLIMLLILWYWIFVPLLYVTDRSDMLLSSSTLIAIEVFASTVLCGDIYLCFHTACIEKASGLVQTELPKIRSVYLYGTFTWDCISGLPFDLLILLTLGADYYDGWIYKLAAHLRLFKIARFPSLFAIVNSLKLDARTVKFHYGLIPNMKMLFYCIISLHLITVLFMLINQGDTYETSYGIRESYTYTTSLYWTLYTVSSVGYGDVELDTPWKRRFASVLFVVGVVLHGVVISEISLRMQKGDVASERRDTMKETLNIMSEFSIPDELQKEVFAFQYHRLHSSLGGQFMRVLETLPSSMRKRIDLYVRVRFICKVPMFATQDFACLVSLANALRNVIFEPEEVIIRAGDDGAEMYFMAHGFGDVLSPQGIHWGVIRPGGFFGETALLNEAKRNATIRALTYCDLFILEKDKFREIMSTFPALEASVKQEADKRKPTKPADECSEEGEPKEDEAVVEEIPAIADGESTVPKAAVRVSLTESQRTAPMYGNELTVGPSAAEMSDTSTPCLSDTSQETSDALNTTARTARSSVPNPLSPTGNLSDSGEGAGRAGMNGFHAFSKDVPMMMVSPPAPPPTEAGSRRVSAMVDARFDRLEARLDDVTCAMERIEALLMKQAAFPCGPSDPPPPPPLPIPERIRRLCEGSDVAGGSDAGCRPGSAGGVDSSMKAHHATTAITTASGGADGGGGGGGGGEGTSGDSSRWSSEMGQDDDPSPPESPSVLSGAAATCGGVTEASL